MSDKTTIEWTDATWTPIRARNRKTGKVGWHCEHVTPGCEHCYAETLNGRLGTGLPFKPGHRKDIDIFLDEKMLTQPLRWKKPRMIFVCSMTDLFAEFVTDEMLDRIFAVMALCPQHRFQVLTKRPERMRKYLNSTTTRERVIDAANIALHARSDRDIRAISWDYPAWPLPNVWAGTSCEDQTRADERLPHLLATPAAVRWVSAEPLLGPIDFTRWLQIDWQCSYCLGYFTGAWETHCTACSGEGGWTGSHPFNRKGKSKSDRGSGIDWIVAGGESGAGARPMHPDWARSIRDQCAAARVAFHFKQWGEFHPEGQQWPDGSYGLAAEPGKPMGFGKVGKKLAGRKLDGVTHDGYPQVRT